MEPSGHRDNFCRERLPSAELWPDMSYDVLPELAAYPRRLNCAAELLDRQVDAGNGDRTVFLFPGGRWTYRDLLGHANRIARVLVEDLGLVPGGRVLLRGRNTPMLAACWFAVLKAGGVAVCTMPLLRTRELAFTAEKAAITLALCEADLAGDCDGAMGARGRVVRYGGDGGAGSLEALAAGKPDDFENADTAWDDVALIAFTSGTTGQGKGTMHFHRDVLAVCDCFPPYVLRARPEDVFIGSPPFAFTFGLGGLVLFPMRIGAASVLLPQASPPHLIRGIEEFGATVCFTAPTAYRAMVPLLAEHDAGSLRLCVSAGETLPRSTFEAWEAATGVRIIDGIGATELLHIFISASGSGIRPGSTGRPVPGYEARVVDDDGVEVPAGAIGRLAVRGPTGCRYLDDPERQRAYVQQGWNLTGDSYVVDDDGWFWYQARTDDMIISAGNNISGPEVESVLLEHPAVQECGVVGLPDDERGQVVTAFIVLRDGHEPGDALARTLQDHVKNEIAPYKYPRRIHFVPSLPRTATGKLQRFRLREAP